MQELAHDHACTAPQHHPSITPQQLSSVREKPGSLLLPSQIPSRLDANHRRRPLMGPVPCMGICHPPPPSCSQAAPHGVHCVPAGDCIWHHVLSSCPLWHHACVGHNIRRGCRDRSCGISRSSGGCELWWGAFAGVWHYLLFPTQAIGVCQQHARWVWLGVDFSARTVHLFTDKHFVYTIKNTYTHTGTASACITQARGVLHVCLATFAVGLLAESMKRKKWGVYHTQKKHTQSNHTHTHTPHSTTHHPITQPPCLD